MRKRRRERAILAFCLFVDHLVIARPLVESRNSYSFPFHMVSIDGK
jgi:hypothetical protein